MNKTITTNAMTVPSTMIAVTTPVIMYTGPGPSSMLAPLLWLDTVLIILFVALLTSAGVNLKEFWGTEVVASNEASVNIEAIPGPLSIASDDTAIKVVLETLLSSASDESVQIIPESD